MAGNGYIWSTGEGKRGKKEVSRWRILIGRKEIGLGIGRSSLKHCKSQRRKRWGRTSGEQVDPSTKVEE